MLSRDNLNKIINRTRKGGGEIVGLLGNGSAFYGPALSAIKMAESYLHDTKRMLPCAAYLSGQYNVHDMFVGVPVIIGKNGVEKIIELPLTKNETDLLSQSINSVKTSVDEVNKNL
jgi:malate dehydrogenase